MSTKAQVLVTGWNGFLGSYLCDAVAGNGDSLIRCGRIEESEVRCDLSESIPSIPNALDKVIHSAGLAHKPSKQSDRDLFQRGNVDTTANLLRGLENTQLKSFTLISSVSVYGRIDGHKINERAATDPYNEYGKSKLDAENLVLDWTKQRNISCNILRLPLIVGRSAPGNLQQLIKSIRSGRFVLPGGGTARKSMVLARDVAEWAVSGQQISGVYNLTDKTDPSYFELCNAITTHYQLSSIPKIPAALMQVAGKVGDIGSVVARRPLPYNSSIHQQLTNSLTFSCDRATKIGWQPNPVIENSREWLSE